jgi:hypothetical protein
LACLSRAVAGSTHPICGKEPNHLRSFHRTFDTTSVHNINSEIKKTPHPQRDEKVFPRYHPNQTSYPEVHFSILNVNEPPVLNDSKGTFSSELEGDVPILRLSQAFTIPASLFISIWKIVLSLSLFHRDIYFKELYANWRLSVKPVNLLLLLQPT